MSSFAEEVNPLEVPSLLLKKKKLKPLDPLTQKYNFDKIGTNDFIITSPSIIKFEGFETMKLNIKTLKIINNSTKIQRVHILPPGSAFFRLNFKKKGNIAPGMSELISVHFTPSEYKYFYDVIRIHTEDESIQVPIHAYPVLDRKQLRDVFPKLIDFGIKDIGTRSVKSFKIKCQIPLNFEFKFTPVRSSQKDKYQDSRVNITTLKKGSSKLNPKILSEDIKIQPTRGLIPGNSYIEVNIEFFARKAQTSILEVDLEISQFGFDPMRIRIMGQGRYKGKQFAKEN